MDEQHPTIDPTADRLIAEQHKRVRAEIARYPHGYAWHKGPGGGLPDDWHESELTQLRPHDWTQARHFQFVRVASPRRPKMRAARARQRGTTRRVRRPGARRAAGIRAGQDPGDPEPGEHEPAAPRLALAPKPRVALTFGCLTLDPELWREIR